MKVIHVSGQLYEEGSYSGAAERFQDPFPIDPQDSAAGK